MVDLKELTSSIATLIIFESSQQLENTRYFEYCDSHISGENEKIMRNSSRLETLFMHVTVARIERAHLSGFSYLSRK